MSFLFVVTLFLVFGRIYCRYGNATDTVEDNLERLQEFISEANCDQLSRLHSKVSSYSQQPAELSGRLGEDDLYTVQEDTEKRLKQSKCHFVAKRQISLDSRCQEENLGDGWCDPYCNTKFFNWDDGDCCPYTCNSKPREFPCGSGGYNCKIGGTRPPLWFLNIPKFCLRWTSIDGQGYQCNYQPYGEDCAEVNSFTFPYVDDTNEDDKGGCKMEWKILTPISKAPDWFYKVEVCFQYEATGDKSQCRSTKKYNNCARINSYTEAYEDFTRDLRGGCKMSWKLTLPLEAEEWFSRVSLCFKWRPISYSPFGNHCGGGILNEVCAKAGDWTSYYLDNTSVKNDGCRLSWGLFLT